MSSVAGLVLAIWFGGILAARDWNPSTLLAAGEDDVRVTAYVTRDLGPAFVPQEAWGHDGKFVFIQAHDPFLLHLGDHAAWLDTPVYRSQRVLVPAIVGVGSGFGPWGVVWAMPITMVLAVMAGAWATGGLAQQAGRSAWWGTAFLLNPGLFYAYRRGTVDVVAVALLMVGVYLVASRRFRRGALALAGAVLAKEVMILGAVGMAIYHRREGRSIGPVLLWPLLAGVGWGLYVRLRLSAAVWSLGVDAVTVPFGGVAPVIGRFPSPESIVALMVLGVCLVTVAAAWRRPSPISWAAVGFALLLLVLPETVWGGYVDAWRAAAPILALQLVGMLSVVRGGAPAATWWSGAAPERETEPILA